MNYLEKAITSVNTNIEEALKELEEVNKVAQNKELKAICETLKNVISEIDELETAIDLEDSML